jgi:acyl carrier protein
MRTRFVERDGTLRQLIDAPWAPRVHRPTVTTPGELAAVLREECNHPFNLAAGRLLRAALIDEPGGGQVLLLNLHHIIADEASLPIMLRELATFYGDPDAELPEPKQYRESVVHQRPDAEALDRVVCGLRGAPPYLQTGDVEGPHGIVPVQVPTDLLPRMRSVQAARGVSWLMLVATAVGAMLHRWSLREDITFGLPVANRDGEGYTEVVGPCLNTLVIRSRCGTETTLSDLLVQMRKRVLDAMAHQHVAFEEVVRALNPPRRFGAAPYLDVVLAPQVRTTGTLHLGDAVLEQLSVSEYAAAIGKFGLTVSVVVFGDDITVALDYRGDRFDRRDVRKLAQMLSDALMELVDEPDAPVRRGGTRTARNAVTELERRVAQLWREVLGREDIDVDDRFFDVGGDSLTLVALHGRLCTELNLRMPIRRLFEAGTIRGFVQILTGPTPNAHASVAERAEMARLARTGRS